MSAVDTTTIEQQVFAALAALGTEATITREATLEHLDVDSLDMAEFAQIIDEELGLKLEGKDLKGVEHVGGVVDVIVARLQA